MHTKSKGQGTVVLVSVAIIASFLAGAVAFNQVRLIPDEFELRTNDLDPMTRAEVRGKNTASNFVPQSAWYQFNNITYNLGQEFGGGISGDSYDGYVGPDGDKPVKNIDEKYYDEVVERLQNQFDGYASDELQYSKCRVVVDPDIEVEYGMDQANPIISSSGSDGLVTVYCRDNGLGIKYNSDQSEYEIDLNNNRFPQLLGIMAAGAFEARTGKNGVEQFADHVEKDEGQYDAPGAFEDHSEGYWDTGVSADSCEDSESDARSEAEQSVRDEISSRINDLKDRFEEQAVDAMEDHSGGDRICFLGACTPPLPGNINWDDIGKHATVVDSTVEINITGTSTDDSPTFPCSQDWEGSATAEYYLNDITVIVKAEENRDGDWDDDNFLASSNQILVDSDGDGDLEKEKIVVKDKIYHNFDEPSGY